MVEEFLDGLQATRASMTVQVVGLLLCGIGIIVIVAAGILRDLGYEKHFGFS